MSEPVPEDARAFFELANRFVAQANDLAEEHGRARVAAAILWAASRYGAFAWAMSGAPGKQSTEDALDLFGAQYRKMMDDNLQRMMAEFKPPPG
jgi:aryl-alcohol dehydrogenase-like predicted oxidoreductase